jgi:hypothetical protein
VSQFCVYGAGRHAEDLLAPLIFDRGRDAVLCLVDDFDPDRNEADERFFISSRTTISQASWIGNFVSISPRCTAAAVPARPLGRAEC